MEAYLIENPDVLIFDNDAFSNVEILAEELTLKDGRFSKDTSINDITMIIYVYFRRKK